MNTIGSSALPMTDSVTCSGCMNYGSDCKFHERSRLLKGYSTVRIIKFGFS